MLIPVDQQARKVLELTFREALRMGHNYIRTEHILLALAEFENGRSGLPGYPGVSHRGSRRSNLPATPT